MTANPFGPVRTAGACLVCGEPIAHKIRGRPRLYCERVRCRRRGARKRAQAAAWEEGQAAKRPARSPVKPRTPTYEDGLRDGRLESEAAAAAALAELVEKVDAFVSRRSGEGFLAMERAVFDGRRWLESRRSGEPAG